METIISAYETVKTNPDEANGKMYDEQGLDLLPLQYLPGDFRASVGFCLPNGRVIWRTESL